jgi:hypothetical protein
MRSMQAYTRLDKIAHGHVQAWGGVHWLGYGFWTQYAI